IQKDRPLDYFPRSLVPRHRHCTQLRLPHTEPTPTPQNEHAGPKPREKNSLSSLKSLPNGSETECRVDFKVFKETYAGSTRSLRHFRRDAEPGSRRNGL